MPPVQQYKRSVVANELGKVEQWLRGSLAEAIELLVPPVVELIDGGPA